MKNLSNNKSIFIIFLIIAASLYFIGPISHYAGLIALISGICLSSTNLFYKPDSLNQYRKLVLNASVIFFGFSLNIQEVIDIGLKGIVYSFISLCIILIVGYTFMKLFKTDKKTSELTMYGTAICGGSAISAVSGVTDPNNKQLAVSTAIVFTLNGLALIIFPAIGDLLRMTQEQFGVFAALSVHDVSSVVGAATIFGEGSLKIATVLKLTRTLWIIPIVIILSRKNQTNNSKLPLPLFILGFILASIITSIFSVPFITNLSILGKILMPIALFMVGYAINMDDIRSIGKNEISFGLSLWVISITVGIILAFMW